LQLHARAIMVPLYKNKDAVKVEAPLPKHMRDALAAFG
jgi:tRNA pseudouridine32 synthase/23S rRNA pseudouridine746 synthase